MLKKINLSAALIVLICFFLPWEQVSCGGAHDTLTGLNLARDHASLWFVPLAMAVVLVVASTISRKEPNMLGLVFVICGAVASYLMNRERMRVNDEAGAIVAQLTGWFWLAFFASLVELIGGLVVLLRRPAPK